MGNVKVRKNEEGYELNLNALIYSELLMRKIIIMMAVMKTSHICHLIRVITNLLKKSRLNAGN